jgi:hypothetical protein
LSNTTGGNNTATGQGALFDNSTGGNNTAIGISALFFNGGSGNTAIGAFALEGGMFVGAGNGNTATGYLALLNNTGNNAATGAGALFSNTTGVADTAIGSNALATNTTGSGNVALGAFAGNSVTTANDVICIGASVSGENVSASCYIGSIFGQLSSEGTGVFINSVGKLGTTTSSRRFKEDIKPMKRASEALFALKPVAFRYKKKIDPKGTPQFGLVAEEVEKVNPDLIVRDKEGKPYSVRYDQVNAMLLNEFLKEHKAFVEEHRTVEELKKEVAALTAGLQKVSAQLEVNKPASQVAENNQ